MEELCSWGASPLARFVCGNSGCCTGCPQTNMRLLSYVLRWAVKMCIPAYEGYVIVQVHSTDSAALMLLQACPSKVCAKQGALERTVASGLT